MDYRDCINVHPSFKLKPNFQKFMLHELAHMGLIMNNGIVDDWSTLDYQRYTLLHKEAFLATQLALTGRITMSGILHDVDKLVLYGLYNSEFAGKLHSDYSKHHYGNIFGETNMIEAIIDYECDRFIRAGNFLNAHDLILSQKPYAYEEFKPILSSLGLDSSENISIDFHQWDAVDDIAIQAIMDLNILYIRILRNKLYFSQESLNSSLTWFNTFALSSFM